MEKMEDKEFVFDNFFSKSLENTSKTRNIDEILNEKLENAFQKHSSQGSIHDIVKIATEHSSVDLAYAACHIPPGLRPILYDNLPNNDDKVIFLLNTDSATRQRIFRYMKDSQMKKIFEKFSDDEAVKVMEDMSERRCRRVMEILGPKKAFRIKEMKKHNRNSAGRLMTNEFFAFDEDMTLRDAMDYIRDYPRIDFSKGVFILNSKRELLGYVPARNLIINNSDIYLKQIMRPVLHKVSVETTREDVVDIVERYKISSLPVIDNNNRLIGVIAYEDVMEAMEDLADETLAKITGTYEKISSDDNVIKRFLSRFPWLLVTLFVGLINMIVMSSFQKVGKGVLTFVLFFVPLITGMSGNIGIQSSTILVRKMALGTLGNRRDSAFKELYVGILAGIVFGMCCSVLLFIIDYFFPGCLDIRPFILSIIIGSGLIGACFTATVLSISLPLFFEKVGVDPAVASGPIITAFNDFLSMSIYFLISWGLGMFFF